MKNIILIIIMLSSFISCNKSEEITQLKELPGSWNWTSSCGGFTGACSYPDDFNYKLIQITEDRFVHKINGQIEIDNLYQITRLEISETNYPYEKNYELTLSDGQLIEMTFIQDKDLLFTTGSDFNLDSYKRE